MKLFLIFILLAFPSCCFNKEQPKIEFYSKTAGSNNGFTTYHYNFKISNYKKEAIKLSQLHFFAKKYIDSVKQDKPISLITFIGEPSCTKITNQNEDYFGEVKKYKVVSFGFNNSFHEDSTNQILNLRILTIWEKGKSKEYFVKNVNDKKLIDSLLE